MPITLAAGMAGQVPSRFEFWDIAISGGVCANVCFPADPIVESYLARLGIRVRTLRLTMIDFGTIAVGVAAIGAVVFV